MMSGFLKFLDAQLLHLGGSILTPGSLLAGLGVVIASLVLSRMLQSAIRRVLESKGQEVTGGVGVAARLLHYMVLVVGLAVALQTAGIQLGALFAAGAVFAVGLGFAMQNLTQNFVSGVLLLIENSIKPGDVVEIEGTFVRVRQMGLRMTVVRSLDDEDLVVPNSILVQGIVKNYTLQDKLYRLRVTVGVAYGSDMDQVRSALEQVGSHAEFRVRRKHPVVLMTDFASSSVCWELSVWIQDPWSHRLLASELRQLIWSEFRSQGITIAFPQLDVHLDAPMLEAASHVSRFALVRGSEARRNLE